MRFCVGDLIRNNITQEEGRVVRLVEKNDTVSYIVVLPASALRAEREALWRQYEVSDEQRRREGDCYESAANEISKFILSG